MNREHISLVRKSVEAHAAAADRDVAQMEKLSLRERGLLIEQACEAAAAIQRSRLAAGLPIPEPVPWPQSTWEFLRKNSVNART